MSLRDATYGDIEPLLALEAACYPPGEAFTRDVYAHALREARTVNLVWEQAGEARAFVGAFHHRRWRAGHVYTLNVHPAARRRGLGGALLAACERRLADLGMRRVALEVSVLNEPAIRLYEKAGYVRARRIEDYYQHHADNDAWAYEKDLAPSRSAAASR